MPEAGEANIEIARHLHEKHESGHPPSRLHPALEIAEAVILALVAITTAWSGYQAARWDGAQARLYGQSAHLKVDAQTLELKSNQVRAYNAATVVEWLKAEEHGETKLAVFFERRMLPDLRPAFAAWKQMDPVHNSSVPPSPMLTSEFHDKLAEEAETKDKEASELFERGTEARELADDYVRVTVLLATVLFLTAMAQRFHSHRIRVMLVGLAFVMLCIPVWEILTLPRT
jgi:hypothetical protein